MITEKQLHLMAKIFRHSGRTFQAMAREAGLENIPDHVTDLSEEEADVIIKAFSGVLMSARQGKQ